MTRDTGSKRPSGKRVRVSLTPNEAAALYIAAMMGTDDIQSPQDNPYGWTGHEINAFFRAIEKLQAARSEAGGYG